MKHTTFIKALTTYLLFVLFTTALSANAAQPGIRSAGGMGGFTLLFPEDSLAYQQIQMQKERVSIQLYKGFAVVRGEYWMYNDSDEAITMQSGYPIHAVYESHKRASDLTEIYFDTLYQMKVLIDGVAVDTQVSYFEQEVQSGVFSYNYNEAAKWYTWPTTYAPKGTTKLEVFFILETNAASISEGYDRVYRNSFIYVLETGASWKPPIGEGLVQVQLMDGLELDDIKGVSPNHIFRYDGNNKVLTYSFKALEPTREDNIAITYHEKMEGFDFNSIISKSDRYFKIMQDFSSSYQYAENGEIQVFDSPFEVPNTTAKVVGGILIAVVSIPLIILGIIIFLIVRYYKRKNK